MEITRTATHIIATFDDIRPEEAPRDITRASDIVTRRFNGVLEWNGGRVATVTYDI